MQDLPRTWEAWGTTLKRLNPNLFEYADNSELFPTTAVYYRHLHEFYLSGGTPEQFWKTHQKVIIYHITDGVFVGEALGLGFWSKLLDVEHLSAPSFYEREIQHHLKDNPSP